ncbi:cupin domain-containing protein [Jannaschia sp. LMIT008]|uniref:cupin domain-containing protein n=1 Tax=Jannaschia maritima TaxID=3032585 RepID=UPI002811B91E|nr:cupin domain-containing protein [Jannaschia sp. LMIT008]
MTADDVIAALDLSPHPEGGFYRQTWAAPAAAGERPAGTAIYFLLRDGGASHWHRVDAAEIWLFHAGAPIDLRIAANAEGPTASHPLGPDLTSMRPQVVVPAGHWQAARTTGPWTLVSCTVCPGFTFDGFELAPPGFDIPAR